MSSEKFCEDCTYHRFKPLSAGEDVEDAHRCAAPENGIDLVTGVTVLAFCYAQRAGFLQQQAERYCGTTGAWFQAK